MWGTQTRSPALIGEEKLVQEKVAQKSAEKIANA
jgi:hypothetical protein